MGSQNCQVAWFCYTFHALLPLYYLGSIIHFNQFTLLFYVSSHFYLLYCYVENWCTLTSFLLISTLLECQYNELRKSSNKFLTSTLVNSVRAWGHIEKILLCLFITHYFIMRLTTNILFFRCWYLLCREHQSCCCHELEYIFWQASVLWFQRSIYISRVLGSNHHESSGHSGMSPFIFII